MLKIQRTVDRTAVVLTVSGRLDAENVGQLCESLDTVPIDTTVALDLRDLVLCRSRCRSSAARVRRTQPHRAPQLSGVHSDLDGSRGGGLTPLCRRPSSEHLRPSRHTLLDERCLPSISLGRRHHTQLCEDDRARWIAVERLNLAVLEAKDVATRCIHAFTGRRHCPCGQ